MAEQPGESAEERLAKKTKLTAALKDTIAATSKDALSLLSSMLQEIETEETAVEAEADGQQENDDDDDVEQDIEEKDLKELLVDLMLAEGVPQNNSVLRAWAAAQDQSAQAARVDAPTATENEEEIDAPEKQQPQSDAEPDEYQLMDALLGEVVLGRQLALHIPFSALSSWESNAEQQTLTLKVRFADIFEEARVSERYYMRFRLRCRSLPFDLGAESATEDSAIKFVKEQLRLHINSILLERRSPSKLIEPKLPPVRCPSPGVCDARVTSSEIRRTPELVFASDETMLSTQKKWVESRAALVLTETKLYLFEGYSYHYRSYWRYASDEDKSNNPAHPLTEATLRRHAPLWLYTRLFCEAPPRQWTDAGGRTHERPRPHRLQGSWALNLHCAPAVARQRLEAISHQLLGDDAPSSGQQEKPGKDTVEEEQLWYGWALMLVTRWRLQVPLFAVLAWFYHTALTMLNHLLNWGFMYLPSAYFTVNVLRHVDTPHASIRTCAAVCARTYAPFMVSERVLEGLLYFIDPGQAQRAIPGTPAYCLQAIRDATGWHLFCYLGWSTMVFMHLRATAERVKRENALKARYGDQADNAAGPATGTDNGGGGGGGGAAAPQPTPYEENYEGAPSNCIARCQLG
jgi:hypothetical protein